MKKSKVDKAIEQEYYKQACGLQINMLDIPKLFANCRTAIAQGAEVSQAVRAAVLMYCDTELKKSKGA